MTTFRSIIAQPYLKDDLIQNKKECIFRLIFNGIKTHIIGILIEDNKIICTDDMMNYMDHTSDEYITINGYTDVQFIILKDFL